MTNKRSQRDLGAHHRMTFEWMFFLSFLLQYTTAFNTHGQNTNAIFNFHYSYITVSLEYLTPTSIHGSETVWANNTNLPFLIRHLYIKFQHKLPFLLRYLLCIYQVPSQYLTPFSSYGPETIILFLVTVTLILTPRCNPPITTFLSS